MKAFTCPQCGASLEFERVAGPTVKCYYCNSVVIVPAELRPEPPAPPRPPGSDDLPRMTSYPRRTPNRAVMTAVAVAAAIAILIPALVAVFSRSSNKNSVSLFARPTPRASQTPTPTPAPEGYTVALSFGAEGTGPGFFKDEMELAVDPSGRIYVSDETLRVQRFDASGNFLNTWTIPRETKWYKKFKGWPRRLLSARDGEIYAVMAGVIMKFDGGTGEALGAAHGSDYIHDAALVPPGGPLLIVSQKGDDDELVVMGGDGRVARRTHRFVTAQLDDADIEVKALRVAADRAGNAYALYAIGGVYGSYTYDSEWVSVLKFSPAGQYLMRFGGSGREPGQYGVPSGLAVDHDGRAYVWETFDKIHVYAEDGRYLRTLKAPHAVHSLAFDSRNDLYVAGAHRVSKLILER